MLWGQAGDLGRQGPGAREQWRAGTRTEEVEVQQGLVPRHEHSPVPVLSGLQQGVDHLRGLGHQLLEERGCSRHGPVTRPALPLFNTCEDQRWPSFVMGAGDTKLNMPKPSGNN